MAPIWHQASVASGAEPDLFIWISASIEAAEDLSVFKRRTKEPTVFYEMLLRKLKMSKI